MKANITIIGTGYVGLVSGACLAELGHDVMCIDRVASKIDQLNAGEIPIFEPGLEQLVRANAQRGRLRFGTDIAAGVAGRDAVFIAVGTPTKAGADQADLSYVYEAAEQIARSITGFTVVVSKSTVPVGTNQQVLEICRRHVQAGVEVAIASNPEFLREGAAVNDFLHPDRIVVGADDPRALDVMRRIYAPLTVSGNAPLLVTTPQSAELIKYAANAFLAVKISFIDEISNLCEALGADVKDVAAGLGFDKRIGNRFLNPGPGWGGSCLPKDTRALRATAQAAQVDCRIVDAAIRANEARKLDMVTRIRHACGSEVHGKRIAVFGLTFKGQTDDMRESTSLVVLPELVASGAEVVAFDPAQSPASAALIPGIALAASPLEAVRGAELLVVMTDWMIFKSYDLRELAGAMARASLLDLRNLYSGPEAIAAGFVAYQGLGLPAIRPKAFSSEVDTTSRQENASK